MSTRGYTAYIVRPIVQVGRPARAPQSGCREPRALDKAGYAELSQAAPLTPEDLAAVLSGRYPFEPEPGDDLSVVEDWKRILARVEEAIRRGELPAMPTLCEGFAWARKVGLPTVEGALEGADAMREENVGTAATQEKRVSDFDPVLQAYAEEEASRLLEKGRRAPKKTVADNIRKSRNLPLSSETIMRRFRNTWSPDRRRRAA